MKSIAEYRVKGKRGVSEIVGYALLIVIALSLGGLVYAWLKAQVPVQVEKCPAEASLMIYSYSCDSSSKTLTISLENNGFFNIEGFIARIRNDSGGPLRDLKQAEAGQVEIFFEGGGLKPNNISVQSFSYDAYNKIEEITIEPLVIEKKILLCENAIIEQKLDDCS